MDTPALQNAISLKDFFVTNLHFTAPRRGYQDVEEGDITIDVKFSTSFSDSRPKSYTVDFEIEIENPKVGFRIELTSVSLFETLEDITNQFKTSGLVLSSSPAIAFPFVRSYVHQLTTSSGMPSLILPAFNFTEKSKVV